MVYGAINHCYTDLSQLFDTIDDAQLNYNWLVTACECNIPNLVEEDCQKQGYCWIGGRELTALVRAEKIQWIWAVLSGFEPDVPLEHVLNHPFPENDGYTGFWKNPLLIQHPLAKIEIVPFDGSYTTLFFSEHAELVEKFRAGYPQSEDLAEFNARYMK